MFKTIGVDPGTSKVGIAIIYLENNKVNLEESIQYKLIGKTKEERLYSLQQKIDELLKNHNVDDLTVEATFLPRKRQNISLNSPFSLSMARGVIYAVAGKYHKTVVEYDHTLHKKTLTGDGNAKKTQIIRAVQQKLHKTVEEDEAMAISLGYCRLLNYYTEHATKVIP